MTLRVLIADDELMARKRLERLLGAMADVERVASCTTGLEVLDAIARQPVDVALLDIHMPELDGMQASQLLEDTHVIFTTAHAEHALQAFEEGAVDYLLKPIEAGRLKRALDRVRERLPDRPTSTRLPVQTRSGIVLVPHADITHAVIEGESVVLHTTARTYFLDRRLADLERALPTALFRRVHRTALVNLDHVTHFESVDSGGYIAHLGEARVAVSRQAARTLRRDWKLR